MELREVEKHARALMAMHGVGHLEFKFDNSKTRLGQTQFIKNRGDAIWKPINISLSKHYVTLLPAAEVRDVVLHEIAHALVGAEARHGPRWRSMARRVGAAPERCVTPSVAPDHAVVGTCIICGTPAHKAHRLPQRVYYHHTCGRIPLRWTKNGDTMSLEDMPTKYQYEYNRHYKEQ